MTELTSEQKIAVLSDGLDGGWRLLERRLPELSILAEYVSGRSENETNLLRTTLLFVCAEISLRQEQRLALEYDGAENGSAEGQRAGE